MKVRSVSIVNFLMCLVFFIFILRAVRGSGEREAVRTTTADRATRRSGSRKRLMREWLRQGVARPKIARYNERELKVLSQLVSD